MNHSERERLFLELFGANKSRIQRLCYGYLGSAEEVEDLFQEIMTNGWNSLPAFRGEARASTWLYRIAMNTALVYREKRIRGRELTDVADERGGPRGVKVSRIKQALEDMMTEVSHGGI